MSLKNRSKTHARPTATADELDCAQQEQLIDTGCKLVEKWAPDPETYASSHCMRRFRLHSQAGMLQICSLDARIGGVQPRRQVIGGAEQAALARRRRYIADDAAVYCT